MPPLPGMGPAPVDMRAQEIEKRFQAQEDVKKSLESQLDEIRNQLKSEQEKVLLQSLRAKEEENLSVRVEQQLREMQDKLRREKHDQDLQQAHARAENQIKELERRLTEERSSWMMALKNQLKERELIEQDVEKNLSRRLRDVEERYQEEKSQWTNAMRKKDDELVQLKRQIEMETERFKADLEEKESVVESIRDDAAEQRRSIEREKTAELRALQTELESQSREASTIKAQLALLQNQLQIAENLRREDRDRIYAEAKRTEDEIKRDFTRREDERTQYWENMMQQTRMEKESLRKSLQVKTEELSRLETERAGLRHEMEIVRQSAREEALRHMPEVYEQRLVAEKKKWDTDHLPVMQQLKNQLTHALEAQKAISADAAEKVKALQNQLTGEQEQAATLQDQAAALQEQLATFQNEQADAQATSEEERTERDRQNKQYLQRIAELQMRESSSKDQLASADKTINALQSEKAQVESDLMLFKNQASEAETILEERNELVLYKTQTEKEVAELRSSLEAMTRAQLEWKNTVAQLQTERNKRDEEWAAREKAWSESQTKWEAAVAQAEKAKAELTAVIEKNAAAPQAASASPETVQAVAAIRQQMQEMQALLAWLKPVNNKANPFMKVA